eukprot:TRINITY_DN9261_c0_g1_i1.p1 TRINITY_DN9261_c0_g1~~TRINITY_DN9261_c0_g1_i1.p1  ORF type:complete len:546 (-),score=120.91 TRINITY_DN9261_c0_g1_i1:72-1709(-)
MSSTSPDRQTPSSVQYEIATATATSNASTPSPNGTPGSRRNLRAEQRAQQQQKNASSSIQRTGSAGNVTRSITPPARSLSPSSSPRPHKKAPETAPTPAPAPAKKSLRLMFSTGLLLVSAVGNAVFFKKMINKLPNYPYFLSQWTTFVYLPVFWAIVAYQYFLVPGSITAEMLRFPLYKFFVMGCMDSTSGVLGLLGGVHTSGQMQSLLNQTIIPITMVLAYIILKERYKKTQYAGAAVILVGILIALIPQYASGSGQQDNQLIFNAIYLISSIPAAFSGVYKEFAFTVDMEVNYLQAWVATWQMLFGFVLAPINALPFLGDSYIPISQMPGALADGFKCMIGINSIVLPACTMDMSDPTLKPCDMCSGAWVPVVAYISFNMLMNVALVQVIKYGGANVYNFVGTLTLPLVQLSFALAFINNPPEPVHWYIIAALLFIIVGLVVYRYKPQQPQGAQAAEGAEKEGRDFDVVFFSQGGRFIHVTEHFENRKNPQRIRSGYYGRLGIRNSPHTPSIHDSFRGSPGALRRAERLKEAEQDPLLPKSTA